MQASSDFLSAGPKQGLRLKIQETLLPFSQVQGSAAILKFLYVKLFKNVLELAQNSAEVKA